MSSEDLVTLAILSVLDTSNTVAKLLKNFMKDSEAQNLLIELEYLNLEIIPARSTHLIKEYLSSLKYNEARKIKRKFRKIHRKIAKRHRKENTMSALINHGLGKKNQEPDRMQKTARKLIVMNEIMDRLDGKKSL
ncbi:hypothetical protein OAA09_00055 [bacterium]|nr:hypothetical protein [bacterium]